MAMQRGAAICILTAGFPHKDVSRNRGAGKLNPLGTKTEFVFTIPSIRDLLVLHVGVPRFCIVECVDIYVGFSRGSQNPSVADQRPSTQALNARHPGPSFLVQLRVLGRTTRRNASRLGPQCAIPDARGDGDLRFRRCRLAAAPRVALARYPFPMLGWVGTNGKELHKFLDSFAKQLICNEGLLIPVDIDTVGSI